MGERYAFWGAFLICSLAVAQIALDLRIDYYDSYNFLLQARRLTDPSYAFVAFDGIRPRALVGALAGFDALATFFTGSHPTLPAFHLLMSVITMTYVAVWVLVAKRLVGSPAAYLVGLALLTCQLVVHYGAMMLADTLTGLLWGLTALLFFSSAPRPERQSHAIALGILGALLGLAKHYTLALFPALLCFHLLLDRRASVLRWSLIALAAYAISVELWLKLLSGGHSGWQQQYFQILSGINDVKRTDDYGYQGYPWLYLQGLARFWGVFFWPLALIAMARCARQTKRLSPTLGAFAATSILFLCFLQSLSLRELRYLLPFLPALLMPLAWAITRCAASATPRARVAWSAAGLLALFPGAFRSWEDYWVTRTDPVYHAEAGELGRLFRYLSDSTCTEIHACWHTLRPEIPAEFPRDDFYRVFDLGPHFTFHVRKPTYHSLCHAKSPAEIQSPRYRANLPTRGCYLVSTSRRGGPPFLTALRPTAGGWEAAEFLIPKEPMSYAAN